MWMCDNFNRRGKADTYRKTCAASSIQRIIFCPVVGFKVQFWIANMSDVPLALPATGLVSNGLPFDQSLRVTVV